MESNILEGLVVFDLQASHRIKLRTPNMVEKINKEIKRRTKIVGIFPNNDSCLRLISAILMEIDESWLLENKYLNLSEF